MVRSVWFTPGASGRHFDAFAKKGVTMKDMTNGSYPDAWATSWNAFKSDIMGA